MDNNSIGIIISIAVIVIIVAAFAVGIFTYKKRKAASWTGTVVDKDVQEQIQQSNSYGNSNNSQGMNIRIGDIGIGNGTGQMSGRVTHSYSISVRPDSGDVFTWSVSSGFYETVSIGDRLSKPAGTLTPEIVEKASASAPTPPAAPPSTIVN